MIAVQHCGSTHIQHFKTINLVSGRHLLLWQSANGHELHGLTEPQGHQFVISVPKVVSSDLVDELAINDHAIYIMTANHHDVWAATLPAALR